MIPIRSSEITTEDLYRSRRRFIKGFGLASAALILTACGIQVPNFAGGVETPLEGAAGLDDLGESMTAYDSVINYNNFYEFTTDKTKVAKLSRDFITSPWSVEVGGLVRNPKVYDLDDLRTHFEHEERIYRMRCVEGWSMVIPWVGFPLSKLLAEVEPLSEAQYVRFVTRFDPEQMPGLGDKSYEWPYVEGLRVDEAMHDLTLLSTGLYGKDLLPQSGAPVRLAVPWKYGFKSIKSIMKIELVEETSTSLWPLRRMNMVSTPTSTQMFHIPDGHNRRNDGLAKLEGARP